MPDDLEDLVRSAIEADSERGEDNDSKVLVGYDPDSGNVVLGDESNEDAVIESDMTGEDLLHVRGQYEKDKSGGEE